MKERPILFSAPMIRAILDGTKTQTRRALGQKHKPDAIWAKDPTTGTQRAFKLDEQSPSIGVPWWNLGGINGHQQICPYGKPGDRLWVRESWAETDLNDGTPVVAYRAGGCIAVGRKDAHEDDYLIHDYAFDQTPTANQWKQSIHMPRWASRITLEITDVRVERLQDISKPDVMAEGISGLADVHAGWHQPYAELWDQINAPGSWDLNPWVWVISFKRADA